MEGIIILKIIGIIIFLFLLLIGFIILLVREDRKGSAISSARAKIWHNKIK